jgi:primosomal protein N' (replication factor Y)
LPPPGILVVVDEADAAHKPPGHPRLHSREIIVERARTEGGRLLLLAAAPAAETWWRAGAEGWTVRDLAGDEWPEVVTADTRGILRNHPLTLPLTRAIEQTTRGGERVALLVGRRATGLGCAECGAIVRCPDCGVSLGHDRARAALACAVCGGRLPLPERCPACRGHRFAPLGWDAERVEASVRRRFPRLSVSRTDPRAQVVIGPSQILRAAAPGALGAVGVVALDALLGMPDFRAGERAFALLWAAAEAVKPGGRLVVQTRHPEHAAVRAVTRRERAPFYEHELAFRAELGYPPFRRLCAIAARGRAAAARALIDECVRAVAGIAGVQAYPPAPAGPAGGRLRLLVKGPPALPRLLRPRLTDVLGRRRRGGGVVEVEMDPVS